MAKTPRKFIPQRGDIIWIDFNPQQGKEIMKHRPALVLSSAEYNKIGLALMCPITSKIKGYPFEVKIKLKEIEGAVLSDQIKNLDWVERKAKLITKCDDKVMKLVLEMVAALLIS